MHCPDVRLYCLAIRLLPYSLINLFQQTLHHPQVFVTLSDLLSTGTLPSMPWPGSHASTAMSKAFLCRAGCVDERVSDHVARLT